MKPQYTRGSSRLPYHVVKAPSKLVSAPPECVWHRCCMFEFLLLSILKFYPSLDKVSASLPSSTDGIKYLRMQHHFKVQVTSVDTHTHSYFNLFQWILTNSKMKQHHDSCGGSIGVVFLFNVNTTFRVVLHTCPKRHEGNWFRVSHIHVWWSKATTIRNLKSFLKSFDRRIWCKVDFRPRHSVFYGDYL